MPAISELGRGASQEHRAHFARAGRKPEMVDPSPAGRIGRHTFRMPTVRCRCWDRP